MMMMMMTTRRVLLVVVVVVTLAATATRAHFADPRLSSFIVNPISYGPKSQQAQVAAGDAKVTCTFAYETVAPGSKAVAAAAASTAATDAAPKKLPFTDLSVPLQTMQGQCLVKSVEYWDYEVCIGGRIRQFHDDDSYTLGQFEQHSGRESLYTKGQGCEGKADKAPRVAKLKFKCLKKGPAAVLSIDETEMCSYTIVVATNAVCGYEGFEEIDIAPSPVVPQQVADDGSEDWFLQLSETADGRYVCSVYTLELRASGSKLNFGSFSLRLQLEGMPQLQLESGAVNRFIGRHPGRYPLSPRDVTLTTGTDGQRSTTLSSTDQFDGKLAYLKVYA